MHVHADYLGGMRTTVEIPDDQRARLLEIAAQRGLKGFSVIVQEALERYLEERDSQDQATRSALAVLGTIGESEAEELEASVLAIRSRWR